ncbi:hypothetical protein SAMN05444166_1855 [Singulisphaera sp. GP187]|uniref:YbeD family protein n=1 Tax=Singulisphaera sp. GP187 TaxID=1882752 RepID=UPI000929275E|nr:DUF493 domain-containing protein [Singulisphaera sp. GP187]SIN97335.1 hypothetical protein SAMN05444166_1855 [Singulisphaera sp. GP187]
MDTRPSLDLLESTHFFPGVYRIKAIGITDENFEARVIEVVGLQLASPSEIDYTVRTTPGGRHIAITIDATVQSAQQVREIYALLGELKGLTLLF